MTNDPGEHVPDDLEDSLDPDERAAFQALSSDDLTAIDQIILASCSESWRKSAMVVALSMASASDRYGELPDRFFALRLQRLVSAGRLQAQGDVRGLRTSEVRCLET